MIIKTANSDEQAQANFLLLHYDLHLFIAFSCYKKVNI